MAVLRLNPSLSCRLPTDYPQWTIPCIALCLAVLQPITPLVSLRYWTLGLVCLSNINVWTNRQFSKVKFNRWFKISDGKKNFRKFYTKIASHPTLSANYQKDTLIRGRIYNQPCINLIIPPATKLGGGYTGITLSVRPSVRLSVRLSVDARLGKMVSSV